MKDALVTVHDLCITCTCNYFVSLSNVIKLSLLERSSLHTMHFKFVLSQEGFFISFSFSLNFSRFKWQNISYFINKFITLREFFPPRCRRESWWAFRRCRDFEISAAITPAKNLARSWSKFCRGHNLQNVVFCEKSCGQNLVLIQGLNPERAINHKATMPVSGMVQREGLKPPTFLQEKK